MSSNANVLRGVSLAIAAAGVVTFLGAAHAPRETASARAGTCASTTDSWMAGMSAFVHELMHDTSERRQLRDSLRLGHLDPDIPQIRVSNDSLCNLAGRAINRDVQLPVETTRLVYLIQLGNRYWAEDSTLPLEHAIAGQVLDSTLSEVIGLVGRLR